MIGKKKKVLFLVRGGDLSFPTVILQGRGELRRLLIVSKGGRISHPYEEDGEETLIKGKGHPFRQVFYLGIKHRKRRTTQRKRQRSCEEDSGIAREITSTEVEGKKEK